MQHQYTPSPRFHAGHGFTREQRSQLDAAFNEYLDADVSAEASGYNSDALNQRATEAAEKYDRLTVVFRKWVALPDDVREEYESTWHVTAEEVL